MTATGGEVLDVLGAAAAEVRGALDDLLDWGPAGTRPGQYFSDLAADTAAVDVLVGAGFGVLSEESGETDADRPIVVVLDPVDGSTNASRGIPWFATSLCALDGDGPLASLVVNQATGQSFGAVRGEGAWQWYARAGADGPREPVRPSRADTIGSSLIALSGYPRESFGWQQYRAFGASALDICAVACGMADGFVDCSADAHGAWDYLGALLVCTEAGAVVADALGRELVVRGHRDRRTPVAAATPALLEALLAERRASQGEVTKKG
ncbi:MAG TPA: inositol monophosphatase [Acidimicrobiales bacterium]